MKRLHKIISIFLLWMLCVSMLPVSALALELPDVDVLADVVEAVEEEEVIEEESVEAEPPKEITVPEATEAPVETTEEEYLVAEAEQESDVLLVSSGTCGDSLTWLFDEATGVLTISGDGEMFNFESSIDVPWNDVNFRIYNIQIGSNVTTIGNYAFDGCSNVNIISIPQSIEEIGAFAFNGCQSISVDNNNKYYSSQDGILYDKSRTTLLHYPIYGPSSYSLPSGLISIEDRAFAGCEQLEYVELPSSLSCIGNSAFQDCNNLISLTIPSGVSSIGELTFGWCEKLNSITLPASISHIDKSAFWQCNSLYMVNFNGSEGQWKAIQISDGNDALTDAYLSCGDFVPGSGKCGENLTWTVDEDGLLTISGIGAMMDYGETNYGTTYYAPWDDPFVKEVYICSGVTYIGTNAFNGFNSEITKVTIPLSVVEIGDAAFCSCHYLDTVVYEGTDSDWYNISIGEHNGILWVLMELDEPQYGTTSSGQGLILIGNELTISGSGVLYDCGDFDLDNVSSIVIKDGITSIELACFANCDSLERIVMPNSVTTIGDSCFEDCDNLKSITTTDNITHIGNAAFRNCDSLNDIKIHDGVTYIGNRAFEGCDTLTNLDIPDSVTFIGEYAFYGCSNLETIKLSSNITTINPYTFSHCTSLKDISIPSNVTRIEGWAFATCTSLKSVIIPKSVTSIDGCVFFNCSNLISVTIQNPKCGIYYDHWTFGNANTTTLYGYRESTTEEYAKEYGYRFRKLICENHTATILPSIPPTIYNTGLTEGSHCSVCGEVLVMQEIIPIITIDINGDGSTNAFDLVALMKHLVGVEAVKNTAALDVNDDDKVDILDVICLVRLLA